VTKFVAVPAFILGTLAGGAALGLVSAQGPSPARPAASAAGRVFEIRTYTVAEGQLPALLARFRDHTVDLFTKQGMTNIGYWTPMDSTPARTTLIYVLAHASREAAAASWAAFRDDPEWQRVRDVTTAAGLRVQSVESVFVQATDFSPLQ
jgi:hypothetical protein